MVLNVRCQNKSYHKARCRYERTLDMSTKSATVIEKLIISIKNDWVIKN